jgi:hypothetical protein
MGKGMPMIGWINDNEWLKDAKQAEDGNLQLGSEERLIHRHLLINGYQIFCDNWFETFK